VSDLIARARQYATEAHERIDQRRKYTRQPYQVHLKSVADMVASVSVDAEMIAAAWLHDTVEDTPATFGDLERQFGHGVSLLVADLTDVSRPADGNRAARKAIDRNHTAQASARAKSIKLADLIDNCRDICRHDRSFAHVYLTEAAALLEVLQEGDAALYRRAKKTLSDCARQLGLPDIPQTACDFQAEAEPAGLRLHGRALRLFTEAFTAGEIAEPLRSFDIERSGHDLAVTLAREKLEVAGLRRDGLVVGYVGREIAGAPNDGHPRPFAAGQVIRDDAPLSEVIGILTYHDFCFVVAMGEISGVITRADIQKPIVRMWLFGIVTLTEIELSRRVRSLCADGSWTRLLSAGRLEKAEALLQERRRRGQNVELLDCLQLSDKARILMENEQQRAEFGFPTKAAAARVIRDLESLRNNLAHSQDIVTHDWPQIARLARRIEESAAGSDRPDATRR
jgi:hypothetical protein